MREAEPAKHPFAGFFSRVPFFPLLAPARGLAADSSHHQLYRIVFNLPVDHILPELRAALSARTSLLLQAPPGAGKTTGVPPALLDEPWLAGRKIIMLEPRRLAARAAARRIASLLGERPGERAGYRMRMDTNVGPSTRIEVVTEGVLTRMLQSDPALEEAGLVIFDEFHERSLQADVGLALALQAQALLREDLRILVMSATLDGEAVARLLGDAPIVTSAGQIFPVETRYIPMAEGERLERAVAAAVRRALDREEGDILVFLPGAGEIRRAQELLAEETRATVLALHGTLPQEEQERALEPSRPGERKVVLSTSIAETSLTIEGIRIVIDSGRMRLPRFSPGSGMTRLETVRVSRASADQRRGRAGRLGPGICCRLWSEAEQATLMAYTPPEILEADLAPLALDLAEWGVADPSELAWLDRPPTGAFAQARDLLTRLGALDREGSITPHGREIARLPLHPRLAHMLIRGEEEGFPSLACDLAALLGERDIMRGHGASVDPDLRLRLEALGRAGGESHNDMFPTEEYTVDRAAIRRVQRESRHWRRLLKGRDREEGTAAAGLLLAFAYPDRIAQARPGQRGRFMLSNGRSAFVDQEQPLAGEPFLVAADLDGKRRESRIFLAAPVTLDDLESGFGDLLMVEEVVRWDEELDGVSARRRTRLGALVLRDVPLRDPDPGLMRAALTERIAREGIGSLPWSREALRVRERIAFMHRHDRSWPDVSDEALAAAIEEWLAPHLHGMRRRDDLRALRLTDLLLDMLGWERRAALDATAPSHLTVPSGSRIPLDYSDPDAPVLSVRLQEMFGMTETPRIGGGRVPVTIHLLSPANRPVQVTRDLANFWRTTYFDVRKDLKGRYPKHYWPDDPMQAVPTSRVRPRT